MINSIGNRKFIQKYLEEKGEKYPSKKQILSYIEKIKILWDKQKDEILKEISKLTKFKWNEKKIVCYVVGVGRPFSDPLTIRTYTKSKKRFIQTLTHELIHQIQRQNKDIYAKWVKYLCEKYPEEKRLTRNHILLSAIHWEILQKLEGEKSVKEEIKKHNDFPEYKRAWDIVVEKSPKNIIKKFYEVTNP